MKLRQIQDDLRERVRAAARAKFGVELEAPVPAEVPPRTELGDLAFPVAFELAKRVKQATGEKRPPRAIAEELKRELESAEAVARVEVAGAGYLNVFYDRARFLAGLRDEQQQSPALSDVGGGQPKVIVEHTNINPNKAAHIGHLRNAVLGDTFVRVMRASGQQVEVENYIDNTGVQVADVVVGFMHVEGKTLAEIQALDASLPPERPFDYYCWDLYAQVGLFYRGGGDPEAGEDPERLKLRAQTLHDIEHGTEPTASIADYVATRIVNCHLDTMERLGIRYDVLPRESEILHFMWRRAFEHLKETGAIRFETEGKNKGCWVMPMETHTGTEEHEADKVIVRSNGTITYTGKDIAYQLWKLGQLGLDFDYAPFRTYPDGHVLWVTTSAPPREGDAGERPHFGAGQKVYNVIDSRQSYTQDVVRKGVAAVAPEVGEEASVHLSYEMVTLSPAACEELGIQLSPEDRQRSHIEMSGRKGLGIKADDLIDTLEANALREAEGRYPDAPDEERRDIARALAVSALRYYLLRWTRNSLIAFDFAEALSTKGETGPYCQYAVVRANSIFRLRLPQEEPAQSHALVASGVSGGGATGDELRATFEGAAGDELWSVVTLAARLEEVYEQSAQAAEPSHLAKYAFQLSRAFNNFYHKDENRILDQQSPVRRAVLIVITDYVRKRLTDALSTLGIEVPERM